MIVYTATNKINNKVYVGQTVRKLSSRKCSHFLASRSGSELPFHRAIRKYGEESFVWEIIYHSNNLQDLNEAEEYLITEYNTREKGYNVAYGGNNKQHPPEIRKKLSIANRGKKHSLETREKMGKSRKGRVASPETREKLSIANRGKKHSPETRKKLSTANQGRKLSLETRKKMSLSALGKKRSPEVRKNMSTAQKAVKRSATGEENSNFDHRIYAFRHATFGLAFCTKYALREEFGVKGLYSIFRGKRNHTGGWSLATPEYLQNLREGMGEIICQQ